MSENAGRKGSMLLISGPSGSGKSTICKVLLEDPEVVFSVSATTREPRPGEVDGTHYHFLSKDEFKQRIRAGEFIEHAEYAGHLYGTSWTSLQDPLDHGFDLLIEIEVQGARQMRNRREDARFLFLLPPDRATLEQRLRGRGTDAPEVIEHRLALAGQELEAVAFFDYAIVNDDLETCVNAVLEIVDAERSGDVSGVRSRFGRAVTLEAWKGFRS